MQEANRDLLGLTEFEENFYNYLSRRVVPNSFIENNELFLNDVLFGLYTKYVESNLSIRDCVDIFEVFLDNTFYHLSVEKPNDSVKI